MGVVIMRCRPCFELLLIITLLLTACVPLTTPPDLPSSGPTQTMWGCSEVIDDKLKSFPFWAKADELRRWIIDEYQMTVEDVQFDLSADGAQSMLKWNWPENRNNNVTLWNDGRESALVWVVWKESAPTLADVLRCLGDPPLYRAYHAMAPEAMWTYLELWYPERGIMATAYIAHKTSSIKANQAVADISYVQPGLPEDLITRYFWTTETGSVRYKERLEGLKSWPGDISLLIIDERG